MTRSGVRFARLFLVLILLAPGVQYLPLQLEQLRTGETLYFTLGDEQLLDAGWWRYSKDVALALFSIAWPWLVWRSRHRVAWAMAKKGMVAETLMIVLGLLGHLADPVPELLLAGLRWPMLVHASLGTFCLGIALRTFSETFNRRFAWVLLGFVLYCAWLGTLQWDALEFPEITGLRLTGVFANAQVFGFAALAIALYAGTIKKVSIILGNAIMILAFWCSVLSGTRGAMLGVILVWGAFLWNSWPASGQRTRRSTTMLTMLFAAIAVWFVVIPYLDLIADRGGLIEMQQGPGGRLYNLGAFLDLVLASSFGDILIGKGLGFGTNSAYILFPEFAYKSWNFLIDNTLATLFLQVGLLGLLLALSYGVILVRAGFSVLSGDSSDTARMAVIMGVLLVAMFAGNLLESHFFLPFLGMVFVNLVGERIADRGRRLSGTAMPNDVSFRGTTVVH